MCNIYIYIVSLLEECVSNLVMGFVYTNSELHEVYCVLSIRNIIYIMRLHLSMSIC
jgi:hypothetical protein